MEIFLYGNLLIHEPPSINLVHEGFNNGGNLETVRIFHLGSYLLCCKQRGEDLFNWNIHFNHFGQHGVVSNLIICFGGTLINIYIYIFFLQFSKTSFPIIIYVRILT